MDSTTITNKQTPLVIVLDLDGTIIGDITYQVTEWEMLSQYDPRKLKAFRARLRDHLQNGLIRPHFTDFITRIKASNDNVEFYIYTASDDKWSQVIIPTIESVTGIKFNRPIFSRKNCKVTSKGTTKSLTSIAPIIYSRLKNKYPVVSTPKQLLKSICIIDNNNVLSDLPQRCMLCPTYDKLMPYDLLKSVDEPIVASKFVGMSRLLNSYGIVTRENPDTASTFLSDYYTCLGRIYKVYDPSMSRDVMWLNLATLVMSAIKRGYHKDATSLVKYVTKRGILAK